MKKPSRDDLLSSAYIECAALKLLFRALVDVMLSEDDAQTRREQIEGLIIRVDELALSVRHEGEMAEFSDLITSQGRAAAVEFLAAMLPRKGRQ